MASASDTRFCGRFKTRVWQFAAALAMLPLASMATDPAIEPAPDIAAETTPRPERGFGVGGYAEAVASDPLGHPAEAKLDALSLFVWWEGEGRWRVFAEAELEDSVVAGRDGGAFEHAELILERLHVDYAWSDALQLRTGKFLTPIGRWNPIHAPPLTWTTSRPLITENTFPTNATGGMLRGVAPVGERALEWAVYASPGRELAPEDGLNTFEEAYGLRLDYALTPRLQIGASLATFEQHEERGTRKQLYGIDFQWRGFDVEVSGEWAYRALDQHGDTADERGVYAQAVAPLYRRLYAVTRYETFDPAGSGPGLHLYVGGLNWRFAPGRALKAEYRHATDNEVGVAEGWLASFTALF